MWVYLYLRFFRHLFWETRQKYQVPNLFLVVYVSTGADHNGEVVVQQPAGQPVYTDFCRFDIIGSDALNSVFTACCALAVRQFAHKKQI